MTLSPGEQRWRLRRRRRWWRRGFQGAGRAREDKGRGRRGRGSAGTSEAALHEGVAQQGVRRRPPLLLHEHLPQEVPAGVGHALGQRGLGGLRGDLENGRHGFVLGPRRLLGQHLHDSAGHTPEDTRGSREDLMSTFYVCK